MARPITALQILNFDWSPNKFLEVTLSKLRDSTKFSGLTLFSFITTSVKFHLKLLSAKFWIPSLKWTLYYYLLYATTTYSKCNNNKHNIVVFYKILKNYNEIELTKNKMDLNNQKLKIIHSPSCYHYLVYRGLQYYIKKMNIIWKYFIRYGKRTMKFNYQKTKWTWNNRKMKSHSPSSVTCK